MTDTLFRIALSSVLLTLAGEAAERALRAVGRPMRGAWVGTLMATAATTLILAGGGSLPISPPRPVGQAWSATIATVGLDAGGAIQPAGAPGAVLGWTLATLLLVLVLAVFAGLQRRRLNRGVRACIAGIGVVVTDRYGPAVAGVFRARIVVPGWLLQLPQRDQRLVVRHEAEHAAAGDHTMSAFALSLCCLLPWNPLVWYQLRRLRTAIELDCDRRVLRGAPGAASAYGLLLIGVAERMAWGTPLATALAHPRTQLERRIRMITQRTRRPVHAAAWAFGALAILAAACSEPMDPPEEAQYSFTEATDRTADTQEPAIERTTNGGATARMMFDDGEATISGRHLVRFEVQVDSDGRATAIRFAPDTRSDLRDAARHEIANVRFQDVNRAPGEWLSGILALD